MSELFCRKTGDVIKDDSMCLACDNSYKQVKGTFISCPEIRQIDNPNVNTIVPLLEKTKIKEEMNVIQEVKEKIKEEEKKVESKISKIKEYSQKSVWDKSIELTKQPVFSLPKKAFLTDIK